MACCKEIDDCRYFKDAMTSLPAVAELMKQRYCKGDPEKCARRLVQCEVGGSHVPPELAPDGIELARAIIAKIGLADCC